MTNNIKWRKGFIFAALICCLLPVRSNAEPMAVEVLQKLPETIGSFHSDDRILTFGKSEYGAALAYRCQEEFIDATVYIYNKGVDEIPDGINSDIVRLAFADSKKEIEAQVQKGIYQDLQLLTENEMSFQAEGQNEIKSLYAVYSYFMADGSESKEGLLYQSFLTIRGTNNHIVKIRASFIVFEDSRAAGLVGWFVRQIYGTLSLQ